MSIKFGSPRCNFKLSLWDLQSPFIMELERSYIIMIALSDDYGLTLTMTVAKHNKCSFPFTGCDSFRESSSLAKAVKARCQWTKCGCIISVNTHVNFCFRSNSEVWTFRRSKPQVASLPYTVHAMDDFLDPPPGLCGLTAVAACHGERNQCLINWKVV